MSRPGAVTGRTGPRRGVVFGAGGVLGFAWMVGALKALTDTSGFDPRSAEVLIGTSAGSVMAALLGGGVDTDTMLRHQRGIVVEGDPRIEYDYERDAGALPPLPRPGIGSRGLLLRIARHPRRFPPLAVIASLAPSGRATLAPVGSMVSSLVGTDGWVPHPATWVVAMDYDTGRRVPFGRPGAPPATLSEAVMASCAIPGWYAPVSIGGHRYVDGGTCSPTSLDLLADRDLDEAIVLAPMASFSYDEPASVFGRLERRWRRISTRRLLHEAEKVRRTGTRVRILAPGREDLEAIGSNLMDPRRRELVLETSLRTTAATLADPPSLQVAG